MDLISKKELDHPHESWTDILVGLNGSVDSSLVKKAVSEDIEDETISMTSESMANPTPTPAVKKV